MDLSLNEAEREHLAALGVVPGPDGALRGASGVLVSPGTAVALLSKAAISPRDFTRAPLRDGHAAASGDEVDLAKMTPDAFRRHYLAAGHAAESPANTGARATTVIPETASHAEPQDFRRGPLQAGHEADPPGSDPAGNNPCPPGASAPEVYAAAERRWAANIAAAAAEHVTPSTMGPAAPLPQRVMLPADMRAGSVPMAAQVHATRPAPGERRSDA
jgi:hypothetical protein